MDLRTFRALQLNREGQGREYKSDPDSVVSIVNAVYQKNEEPVDIDTIYDEYAKMYGLEGKDDLDSSIRKTVRAALHATTQQGRLKRVGRGMYIPSMQVVTREEHYLLHSSLR